MILEKKLRFEEIDTPSSSDGRAWPRE